MIDYLELPLEEQEDTDDTLAYCQPTRLSSLSVQSPIKELMRSKRLLPATPAPKNTNLPLPAADAQDGIPLLRSAVSSDETLLLHQPVQQEQTPIESLTEEALRLHRTAQQISSVRTAITEEPPLLQPPPQPETPVKSSAYFLQKIKQTHFSDGSLTQRLTHLHRATQQADIYISRQSVPLREKIHERHDVSLATSANYTALVDAAFARDARRYDGPLGLL